MGGDRGTLSASVLIPVRNGGRLLERVVERVLAQKAAIPFDLHLLDSGSSREELARLERAGATIRVSGEPFDHGHARDQLAAAATGNILVFLNQDALPADERWLSEIVAPLLGPEPPAAVQGAIEEMPAEELAAAGRRRFYWDSCGPRFYFTSESVGWIERHGGIGFSTVNCAMRRAAWEAEPFGRIPILEDKSWQRRAQEHGWRIVPAPAARVWHTHDYGLGALVRRCASEGLGWRRVGERYRLRDALRDSLGGGLWGDWLRGVVRGRALAPAALLFPVLRPLALWWGNRWAREVRL